MAKGNLDLTSGNVYKTLLSFALPFMIANFIQALYGAVDMAVVGWFSSSASIAAVSIGTQIMQILTSLISGLTMGEPYSSLSTLGRKGTMTSQRPLAPCSRCLQLRRLCSLS